jgi:hypothetical protein
MINTKHALTIFYLILAISSMTAFAGKRAKQIGEKLFLLKGEHRPVQVLEKLKDGSQPVQYMRMPDLDGQSSALSSDQGSGHHQGGQHDQPNHQNKFSDLDDRIAKHTAKNPHGKQEQHAASKRSGKSTQRGLGKDPPKDFRSDLNEPMTFKASVIVGQVRLPRVKFARVGVPMELRDEEPSLDFNSKTLKDNGY